MQEHVKVTPARWWHAPGLSRLIRETRRKRSDADAGAVVWAPRWSPSLGLLESVWAAPMPALGAPRSFVAEQGGHLVGLAQMKRCQEPRQWDVVYLAVEAPTSFARLPHGGHADSAGALRLEPDRCATRLLGELCDAGAALGAERLLASVPENGGRLDLFKQVGFSPVVREYTYCRFLDDAPPTRGVPAVPMPIDGLRPQRRADAYGVWQLYQRITPKVVQMAEGKWSRSWDLPATGLGRRLARVSRVQRWVVERDAQKVGWLQVSVGRRSPHNLAMMVDDAAGDLNQALLEFALALLAPHKAPSIVARVREHQPGLARALETSGFYLVEGHLLMVKQLAAPVLQPQFGKALEKAV